MSEPPASPIMAELWRTIADAHPVGKLVIELRGERAAAFEREAETAGLVVTRGFGWHGIELDGAAVIWKAVQ